MREDIQQAIENWAGRPTWFTPHPSDTQEFKQAIANLREINPRPTRDELEAAIASSGFSELPVRAAHAKRVAKLPLHHADPFDRLLVAQAMTEPMRLLTADAALAPYSELVLRV